MPTKTKLFFPLPSRSRKEIPRQKAKGTISRRLLSSAMSEVKLFCKK
jgi:hypothetical protein